LFEVHDGVVVPLVAADGDPLEALCDAVASREGGRPIASAVLFHSGAPHEAARLGRVLKLEAPTVEFSLALAVHTGPGVVGVAWLQEPAPAESAARDAAHEYAPGKAARATSATRSQPGTTTSNRSRSTALTTARPTRSG